MTLHARDVRVGIGTEKANHQPVLPSTTPR